MPDPSFPASAPFTLLTPDRIDSEPKNQKNPILTSDNFFNQSRQALDDLPPSVDGWIALYLKMQIDGVKADRTTVCVRRDLAKFQEYFQTETQSADLRHWRQRITQRFIEKLQRQSLRPATVIRTLASIRAFAKWLLSVRPDFFPLGNPTHGTRPPIQDALRPKGLTDRQMKLLLDAAFDLVSKNYPAQASAASDPWRSRSLRTIRRPLRDRAILVLMLNTGLRREEVTNLDLSHLQEKKLVGIRCKGRQYRDLLLGIQTVEIIGEYLQRERPLDAPDFEGSQALFLPSKSRKRGPGVGRLSVQAINRIINHVAQEANAHLPETEKFHVNPHQLRHTHAYQLLDSGRDLAHVQRRLGHRTMSYVAIYTSVPEAKELEILNAIEQT